MRLTFLGNSGFALEEDKELLLIDCYNPEAHAFLKPDALARLRSVTVLISHCHGDHFGRFIDRVKPADFVVGFDVPLKEGRKLNPGDTCSINGTLITAYGSTDEGVSFHIQWKGLSLFHAGDLNDWHWRDESDEAYAHEAEANFLKELARIREGIRQPLDIAFFPVDSRMGTDYYRGAIYFAQALRPKRFVPMHFHGAFRAPDAFYEEILPYTVLYLDPLAEGAQGRVLTVPD